MEGFLLGWAVELVASGLGFFAFAASALVVRLLAAALGIVEGEGNMEGKNGGKWAITTATARPERVRIDGRKEGRAYEHYTTKNGSTIWRQRGKWQFSIGHYLFVRTDGGLTSIFTE